MKLAAVLILVMLAMVPTSAARADLLEATSAAVTVLPADESGLVKVAVRFDLSAVMEGDGRRIDDALLEWTVDSAPTADRPARYAVREVLASWDAARASSGEQAVTASENTVSDWSIGARSWSRVGGFVRLDVESLIADWLADPQRNFGVLIEAKDVSRQAVANVLGQMKLIVRYGFIKAD